MSTEPIRLVHVSDVHLGSGESHGRINPETGLNFRFEDFVKAFSLSVTFAIGEEADIFLFSGDAYRNAAPEPVYQKAFANELRRLSEHGIKTVLLVGNHDQILKSTGSHSMSVFQSLALPHVITMDTPRLTVIDTKRGACQIIGIPHVTRHLLMTHEKYAAAPVAEIEKVMASHVADVLRDFYEQLDAQIPSVVTAHMMVDRARAGAEQELMIGYSMTFPVDIFIDPRVDYVALGHVHGHQVLRDASPAIVYAGSIERVDFSEENEDKGFVSVKLARGATTFEFKSVHPRPFITADVDLLECQEPSAELANQIARKVVPGCVLRVRFQATAEQMLLINEHMLKEAAAQSMSLQLRPEVFHQQRHVRMPELTESCVASPLSALSTYLSEVAPARKDALLKRAQQLCQQLQDDQ